MAARPRERSDETKHIRELENEVRTKAKAWAEAAALLVLAKRAQTLRGAAADDTDHDDGP